MAKPVIPYEKLRDDLAASLCHEHLEDASFLYVQRLKLFENPEITWKLIGDFEERFQAHINGIMAGGNTALEICRQKAAEGDPGELYAAVSVFCRQGRKDLILKVLKRFEPEDGERLQALSDALNHEMPDDWKDDFILMLSTCRTNEVAVLARLAGYRRMQAGPELMKILPGRSPEDTSEIIWALGRILFRDSRPLLVEKYLKSEDDSVGIYAAQALLRMGASDALNHCMKSAGKEDWPNTLLGISGGRSAVQVLMKKASGEEVSTNCLLSLGLLGDVSAADTLLKHLENPETAESSALALNLITGAELYEQAFMPDEINEDELFPEELEKFRKGELPTRPDGRPYGVTVTWLSRKPAVWQDWWAMNRSRFNPDIRYRNGKPFSPACLLENLEYEKTPARIRQLAYEELMIRYGEDFPFEADMYVSKQKQVLEQIRQWVASNQSRFKPGEWYFAGQPVA